MLRVYKVLISTCIMAICIIATSCDILDREAYCRSLVSKVKHGDVQAYLESWMNKNILNGQIDRQKIRLNPSFLPQNYWYDTEFNWDILGYGPLRAIIFIGPQGYFDADIKEFDFSDVESIYFTEASRFGVLYDVNTKGVFGFGSDDNYITRVTNNIGVMCLIRDK